MNPLDTELNVAPCWTPRKDAEDAVTVSKADLMAVMGDIFGFCPEVDVDYYEALDRLKAAVQP